MELDAEVLMIQRDSLRDALAELLDARKTVANISFEQWLAGLDHAALTEGYGRRLVAESGRECWRGYYRSGLTPKQALYEDWFDW